MANIKWTQWEPDYGMIRCGVKDYVTVTSWLRSMGLEAKRCLAEQEKPHAIYGRTIHEDGVLSEIRLYCNTYLTDDELDKIARDNPGETLYVAHK